MIKPKTKLMETAAHPNEPTQTPDAQPTKTNDWLTIAISGLGETVITGKNLYMKAPNDQLSSLEPFVRHLAEKQQDGTNVNIAETKNMILAVNNLIVDFRTNDANNKRQRFGWKDIDTQHANAIVTEVSNYTNQQTL